MAIRCLALDVDGVLTKGEIIYTSSGEEVKAFHAKDGLGLALAKRMGLQTAIITGRTSFMVERRAKELNISHIQMGSHNIRSASSSSLYLSSKGRRRSCARSSGVYFKARRTLGGCCAYIS